MIVKDEAAVIRRCIASVLPLIDFVLIVDTGSTDTTHRVVIDFCTSHALPLEIIDEPFRDFAYNRTFALQQLRKHREIDYCLMIDADEQLIFDDGFNPCAFKSGLVHGAYEIQTRHGSCFYNRPQLFSNRLPFCFRSVLHEYLHCDKPHQRSQVLGFYNLYGLDGARSKNPNKYWHDARILCAALRTETDPFLLSRYEFYLANSYRDAKQPALALPHYVARFSMGFWQDEIYLSLLNIARIKEHLRYDLAEVLHAYLTAVNAQPHRAEAYLGAMRLYRNNGLHHLAFLLGQQANALPMPPASALFVEVSAYQYAVADEFAVACNNTRHFAQAAELCAALLASPYLPLEWAERVGANHRYALDNLKVTA